MVTPTLDLARRRVASSGCELCPRCGKNVRKQRIPPHSETAECLIRVTQMNYAKRGWVACSNKTQAELLVKAGGEVEMAPGRLMMRRVERVPGVGTAIEEYAEDRPFAPKDQVRAYQIVEGISFDSARRHEILKTLLVDAELCEAARSVAALAPNGQRREHVRTFLTKMFSTRVRAAELKAGLEELESSG